jgi:hypothetical protein
MKKIEIELTERHFKQLATIRQKTGMTVSEIIKRALSDWFRKFKEFDRARERWK